jgi:hypothetical protein
MLAVCVLAAASSQSGPRFVFQKGDVLTYQVHCSMKGTSATGGEKAAYASALEGKLVLTVQSVRADGTAEVKLTATGKGKITMADETMPLDEEPASPLIAVVKPNGAIVELRDERGEKTGLLQSMENLFGASTQIQTLLIFNYTLFGLQLPAKLPAPGKSYAGTYKQEHGTGADFDSMKIQLQNVPQKFVYKGPGKYEGRDCLVFTCEMKASGPQNTGISIPTTFYFDDKEGRLLAVEQHAKNLGREKMTIDETVRLVVPMKPPGVSP